MNLKKETFGAYVLLAFVFFITFKDFFKNHITIKERIYAAIIICIIVLVSYFVANKISKGNH
jgi:heme/copper-type cytochrome/quinol oxidase subunit 4